MEPKLRRCFVAFDVPKEVVDEVKRIQNLIKKEIGFIGKPTELENLHLTLKFLGEIDDGKIEEVRERLKKIRSEKFSVRLGEAGVFSKKIPKIIWIKLVGAKKLQKEVDSVLEGLFEKENRFMGHITIARVKYVKDKNYFNKYLESIKPKKIEFIVEDFSLKESELFPEGPVYSDLEKYELGK